MLAFLATQAATMRNFRTAFLWLFAAGVRVEALEGGPDEHERQLAGPPLLVAAEGRVGQPRTCGSMNG